MDINEKCQRLHSLFNKMKLHNFTKYDIDNLGFNNGIYIIFEEGETAHNEKRIVRVGTHSKPNNLLNRLNTHRQNSGSSVFRRKIGCAILNRNNPNDKDIDLWYNKRRKGIDKQKLQNFRNNVTQHITQKMKFVAFEINGTSKEEKGTLFWEAKIIATIAKCSDCSSSENWLGHYLPEQYAPLRIAKNNGLWVTNEVDSDVLNDLELKELKNLVEKSTKS